MKPWWQKEKFPYDKSFILPQCFQKVSAAEVSESICMWKRVKLILLVLIQIEMKLEVLFLEYFRWYRKLLGQDICGNYTAKRKTRPILVYLFPVIPLPSKEYCTWTFSCLQKHFDTTSADGFWKHCNVRRNMLIMNKFFFCLNVFNPIQ